ncbi:MAG: hypothetical protein DU429_03530 [Candidatus Tokpelaia sp.]|nr:MAG: hypothetical protein DU430_01395 [Candidatus Tokpelaia sp.]KAA6207179.1 MAG: hypothetical protein DU429_03530 [Candidatus Tokpelaia sp.]
MLYALFLLSSLFYNKFFTLGKYFFAQNSEDSDFSKFSGASGKTAGLSAGQKAQPIYREAKAGIYSLRLRQYACFKPMQPAFYLLFYAVKVK